MSRLKEAIQKRTNYAAKFELPFLDREQIKTLNEHLGELEGEERKSARKAWIAEHCWLKLTVTRIADAEIGHAEEKAGEPLQKLPENSSKEEQRAATIRFLQMRRDLVWPLVTRHITKAVEFESGKWVDVPLQTLSQYFDLVGLPERAYVVEAYYDLVADDKKEAQGDPDFLAKDS